MKKFLLYILTIALLAGLLARLIPLYGTGPVTSMLASLAWPLIVTTLIIIAILLSYRAKRDARPDDESPTPQATDGKPTLDTLIATYGQPDDLILVKPTRGNEPDGAILVYHKGDSVSLVYDGIRLDKEQIADVTFNNASTPYTVNDYQIVLTTTDDSCGTIYIPTGMDASWAHDILSQVKRHLSLP